MTFRARLALAATVAVAAAVLLVAASSYVVTSRELRRQDDATLVARATELARSRYPLRVPVEQLGVRALQVIGANGLVVFSSGGTGLTVSAEEAAVARGGGDEALRDAQVDGRRVRVATVPFSDQSPIEGALQVATPVTQTERALRNLARALAVSAVVGVAIAAVLGRLVARAALAPVERLTSAAEQVATTQDPTTGSIPPGGPDELGRLSRSFNAMLGALEVSRQAQRRLVADASHELRTPLTSLRTNVEVLARAEDLPAAERSRLVDDVVFQLEELTALVGDLVELAREEEQVAAPEEIRLDRLVAQVAERTRRLHPGVEVREDAQPCVVAGRPDRLERALANLLDNAASWSPPGAPVDVTVAVLPGAGLQEAGSRAEAEVVVRDRGPGIAAEDRPFVFDRFYRAPAARSRPGSGLGLAIVKAVAEAHGGSVVVEEAPGGGALLRLRMDVLSQFSGSPQPGFTPERDAEDDINSTPRRHP